MTASVYDCWLGYPPLGPDALATGEIDLLSRVAVAGSSAVLRTAREELVRGLAALTGNEPLPVAGLTAAGQPEQPHVVVAAPGSDEAAAAWAAVGRPGSIGGPESALADEDEVIVLAELAQPQRVVITGDTGAACLHGVFAFLRRLQAGHGVVGLRAVESTGNKLRMLNHWDNIDGSIERGYSGKSIFFADGRVLACDLRRVTDYARLLASVGVNAVSLNNVNVTRAAARLLTPEHLPHLARIAGVFRRYGIKLFLSISFDSPIVLGGVRSADPLDEDVVAWWRRQVAVVYEHIPDLGGFVVKADSESRPGPHVYGRTQAEGANMLAAALAPYGGIVVWRAFVYNCYQDWRDRSTDRARAAYDTFVPLDGDFADNVIVQVKVGPMDFQVREPASPLLFALRATNQAVEVQITQEYTGQQKDLCFLYPQWHEIINLPATASGEPGTLANLVSGHANRRPLGGVAGVANIGDDPSWTGHVLAQANLYTFGRLAWDPSLSPRAVAAEWVTQTFGPAEPAFSTVLGMLLESWPVYESYTAPLGVGWMVTPHYHYGPDIDGYEYSRWGTYHFADRDGIGVDRTVATGTGFTAQYEPGRAALYEELASCPDELLLFFHHVPYTHRLHSGKTVIQHIYDTHFDGATAARRLLDTWQSLEGQLDPARFANMRGRLELQVANAEQWRDVVSTYFFRKSGIGDAHGRRIY